MHKFNNNWLTLREKIDTSSRNIIGINKINSYLKNKESISLIDLGCGTGSNYRYLSPKLKKIQAWDMVDISLESINYFKNDILNNKKINEVNFQKIDAIKNIKKINFKKYDVVTGSAFLDIMPYNWFKDFSKLNKETKVIYFSINYDGFFKFFPKHKDDEIILNLFNKDQQSDKGIGQKAVGQNCTRTIDTMFNKTHITYILNSDWKVEKNKNFQNIFINFCENVVTKKKGKFDEWLKFRRDMISKHKSKLFLKNKDFLALKF